MVAYPIVALNDGDELTESWITDVTDAVNDHQTRVSTLEGVTRQPIWTVFSTAATSGITTTETVFATAPSSTYKAHTAYRIEISGYGRRTDAAPATNQIFVLRDTNAAGTIRMGLLQWQVNVGGVISNLPIQIFHYVANTGGSDILGRVLVATTQSTGGTVVVNASTQKPWYVTCIEVGDDTDFPQAVPL